MRTILIAGASGVAGLAMTQAFLDAGWNVVAASRRPPGVPASQRLEHVPLDLEDRDACRAAVAARPRISHLVYCAVKEAAGLSEGWANAELMQTNHRMFENLLDPLLANHAFSHVSLLQGAKAYGYLIPYLDPSYPPFPYPLYEDQPRIRHPTLEGHFYWLQEDAVRAAAAKRDIRFTILRPGLIISSAIGTAMNVVVPTALFGTLCREQGLPFGYPGGAVSPMDTVDSRILASAALWAADAPAAANETFNVTNGEAGDFRSLWPIFADALGLEPSAERPVSLAQFLPSQSRAWRDIAEKNHLAEADMEKLLGESHYAADYAFGYGRTTPTPLFTMSTIKLRKAGFNDCLDLRDTYRYWMADMVQRRLIPAPRARSSKPLKKTRSSHPARA